MIMQTSSTTVVPITKIGPLYGNRGQLGADVINFPKGERTLRGRGSLGEFNPETMAIGSFAAVFVLGIVGAGLTVWALVAVIKALSK